MCYTPQYLTLYHPRCRSYHLRLEVPSSESPKPFTKASEPTSNQAHTRNSARTYCLMVAPSNAKHVKQELQKLECLDKSFRMIKLSSSIALPIKQETLKALKIDFNSEVPKEPWHSLILDQGELEMPYSTSQYAAKGRR